MRGKRGKGQVTRQAWDEAGVQVMDVMVYVYSSIMHPCIAC